MANSKRGRLRDAIKSSKDDKAPDPATHSAAALDIFSPEKFQRAERIADVLDQNSVRAFIALEEHLRRDPLDWQTLVFLLEIVRRKELIPILELYEPVLDRYIKQVGSLPGARNANNEKRAREAEDRRNAVKSEIEKLFDDPASLDGPPQNKRIIAYLRHHKLVDGYSDRTIGELISEVRKRRLLRPGE